MRNPFHFLARPEDKGSLAGVHLHLSGWSWFEGTSRLNRLNQLTWVKKTLVQVTNMREHGAYLRRKNRKKRIDPRTFEKMEHEQFPEWFKDHVMQLEREKEDMSRTRINVVESNEEYMMEEPIEHHSFGEKDLESSDVHERTTNGEEGFTDCDDADADENEDDPMATIGIKPSVNGQNSNRKRVLAPPVDGPQLVKKPSNLDNKSSMSNDSDLQVSNKNSVSDKNVVRNQEAFDHSYTAQQGETNSAAHKNVVQNKETLLQNTKKTTKGATVSTKSAESASLSWLGASELPIKKING
ncbi:hypothetical protein ZWY2020_042253 [Hordeum vulgare]|nr:hypothetical protein ZWY2020_042253 [Hordeum vulgare]